MGMRRCCRFFFFFFYPLIRWVVANEDSRFLRARKFDVNAAWGQFKDTEDWRRDNAIEKLYENIDVDSYEAARRMVYLHLG